MCETRSATLEVRARIERGGRVETVRLVCDAASLAPQAFYAAVQEPTGWRTLEAIPRRAGGWIAVVVSAPDGARDVRQLDLPAGFVVDYPSDAVEAIGRRWLARTGDAIEPVPVLRVTPPLLDVATEVRAGQLVDSERR